MCHSHKHNHGHDHNHSNHDHDHHKDGHHHCHESESSLSYEQKMGKLLEHWLKHNADHAQTYREWARKSADNGMKEIAESLEEIAEGTLALNRKLEAAAGFLKK